MKGQKHLIECRCFLPQFKKREDPPFHQFPVFSLIDDEDKVQVKFVQCPNCGIVHKVIDLCKSEFVNKEQVGSVVSVDDIKLSLDQKLIDILERYEVDDPTWEQAKFILDNERWGDFVSLMKESDKKAGMCQGKYVKILKRGIYSIESYTRDEFISI